MRKTASKKTPPISISKAGANVVKFCQILEDLPINFSFKLDGEGVHREIRIKGTQKGEVIEWEVSKMKMLGAIGLEKPLSVKTVLIKGKWKESKRKIFSPNLTWMKGLIIFVTGVKGEYRNQKKRMLFHKAIKEAKEWQRMN
jgi:hypothetical protein